MSVNDSGDMSGVPPEQGAPAPEPDPPTDSGRFDPRSPTPRRLWSLALAAGAVAGLVSWGAGEGPRIYCAAGGSIITRPAGRRDEAAGPVMGNPGRGCCCGMEVVPLKRPTGRGGSGRGRAEQGWHHGKWGCGAPYAWSGVWGAGVAHLVCLSGYPTAGLGDQVRSRSASVGGRPCRKLVPLPDAGRRFP